MSFAASYPGRTAASAPPDARGAFLRQVGALTAGGLTISAVTGMATAFALPFVLQVAPFLGSGIGQMVVILGCFFFTQTVARGMVDQPGSTRWLGFVLGTVSQGVAMGWLLLMAMLVSAADFGNPFVLIAQAFALVGLVTAGMFAWLVTGPKDLSLVRGGLSMLTLPMLGLMVISFVWPIGGPLGIALSAVFVVVSAGGVLYQLNQVFHTYPVDRPAPAAYGVTIGLLVLYWNVLSLLMRLNRR